MLPCPNSRLFVAFGEDAVDFLCIYECNIALVLLGFLVHNVKDSLGSRDTHYNRVHLMRNLIDISRKLLGHVEEGDNDADADSESRNA